MAAAMFLADMWTFVDLPVAMRVSGVKTAKTFWRPINRFSYRLIRNKEGVMVKKIPRGRFHRKVRTLMEMLWSRSKPIKEVNGDFVLDPWGPNPPSPLRTFNKSFSAALKTKLQNEQQHALLQD
jgi:hypothetical protein